jgi:methylmalonyl-CoA/ethylmalonyl-CoA epimerase
MMTPPVLPFDFEFDHVGIAVKSLQEGEKIYLAMGFQEAGIEEVAREKVRVKMFELGNSSRVELLEPTSPDSTIAQFLAKRGPGIHHICLRVRDIRAVLAKLKKGGFRLVHEEPFEGAHQCQVAFIHPSSAGGVLVELSQPKSQLTSARGLK